jgi:hypothetical protein
MLGRNSGWVRPLEEDHARVSSLCRFGGRIGLRAAGGDGGRLVLRVHAERQRPQRDLLHFDAVVRGRWRLAPATDGSTAERVALAGSDRPPEPAWRQLEHPARNRLPLNPVLRGRRRVLQGFAVASPPADRALERISIVDSVGSLGAGSSRVPPGRLNPCRRQPGPAGRFRWGSAALLPRFARRSGGAPATDSPGGKPRSRQTRRWSPTWTARPGPRGR